MTAGRRALTRYLRGDVRRYSPVYGAVLDGRRRRAKVSDLALADLGSLGDGTATVLHPTVPRIGASGDLGLIARLAWARLWRRQHAFGRRVVDPRYKPVHWHSEHGLLIGYTAGDLDRLAELGRRLLGAAGVGPADVLVGLVPPGPRLAYWELVLGARAAGVPTLFLGPGAGPAEVARLAPSTLAGRPADLARLLRAVARRGSALPALRTVLAVEAPLAPAARARLAGLAAEAAGRGDVAVVAAWAPPGVRALWSECREGTTLHTAPDTEMVELVDPLSGTPVPPGADGEVVWTPIGWRGSVILRLRTGAYATADPSPCPACRRRGTRLDVVAPEPAFARLLDGHPGVVAWQAELRTIGGDEELIVFLTVAEEEDLGRLLGDLDGHLSATQFVVLEQDVLDARLAAHDDEHVVDLRG